MNLNDLKNFFCLCGNSFVPNVGIGTTIPSQLLHVYKNANNSSTLRIENKSSGNAAETSLEILNDSSTSPMGYLWTASSTYNADTFYRNKLAIAASTWSSGLAVEAEGTNPIYFRTNSSNRMLISSSGNVGIGTSSPNSASILDINGTGNLSAIIVPRATTAERPVTAANGMIRYNTTSNKFEAYQSGAWVNMISSNNGTPTITTKSANFTVGTSEENYLFLVSGATTATLPALSSVIDGFKVTIKRTGGSNITIDADASETIDGALTRNISSTNGYIQLVKTASDWKIIGGGANDPGGTCVAGSANYSSGGSNTLTVTSVGCTYTFTLKGAGGGNGWGSAGGAGGGVIFSFTPSAVGTFTIVTGANGSAYNVSSGAGGFGGGGGGGSGGASPGGTGGSNGGSGTNGGNTPGGVAGAGNTGGSGGNGLGGYNGGAGGSSNAAGLNGGGTIQGIGGSTVGMFLSGGGGGGGNGSYGGGGGGGGYGGGGGGGVAASLDIGGGAGGGAYIGGGAFGNSATSGAAAGVGGTVDVTWN